MDTLSRLNSLLQSLRHAPAHFTITSETIFSVRLSLDSATMKLITSDPYLSARVNSALKKGAKDRNRGAAKRKAALEVVGVLESLVKNGKVKADSGKGPLTKTRKATAMRRKTAKSTKLKNTRDDISSEDSSGDDEEDQVQSEAEEEDFKEDDEYTNCSEQENVESSEKENVESSEKEDDESSGKEDDAVIRSSKRRAASAATVTSQKVFGAAMPVPNKKRKRGMTEAECTEERRRKDARRA